MNGTNTDFEDGVASPSAPWTEMGQRWGHSWHAMSSYLGAFPPALARSMICMLSEPGDIVFDPFSGRGTTLLESRLLGRTPLASDLNPVAIALSNAKNSTVEYEDVIGRLRDLRAAFDPLKFLPEAQVQPDAIQLIYHPITLGQLCFLRRKLVQSKLLTDQFLLGALLGVMHGSERQDGSSAYASISMPNTFSMAPNYVRRFVQTNKLNRVARDVFSILTEKIQRLFRDFPPNAERGLVVAADAKRLGEVREFEPYIGKVRLILTSPPYLDVVNYAKQNWIRNWLFESRAGDLSDIELDDNLTLTGWLSFVEESVEGMRLFLAPRGVLVLVIGDVLRPNGAHISLAREFIQRVRHKGTFKYVGCFDDTVGHEIKTTRIWKDTKGKATEVDRVVILSEHQPEFHQNRLLQALGRSNSDNVDILSIDPAALERYAEQFAG